MPSAVTRTGRQDHAAGHDWISFIGEGFADAAIGGIRHRPLRYVPEETLIEVS